MTISPATFAARSRTPLTATLPRRGTAAKPAAPVSAAPAKRSAPQKTAPRSGAPTRKAYTEAVLSSDLGRRGRRILLFLTVAAFDGGPDGQPTWPVQAAASVSVPQLLSATGLPRPAMREVIASLESRGWLRRQRVRVQGDTRTVYHLSIPAR